MSSETEKSQPIDESFIGPPELAVAEIAAPQRKSVVLLRRMGILLILLSGVFFFAILTVPWLPISGGQKVMLSGALLVGVEVAWWVGAVMVGPAVVGAIKSWFGNLWARNSES